jgi:hypothetical protein
MLHYAVPDEIVGTIDDMMASVRLVGSPRLAPSDERAAVRSTANALPRPAATRAEPPR